MNNDNVMKAGKKTTWTMTTTLALLLLLSSGAAQADLSEDPSDPASWVVEPTLPTLEDSEYGVTLDPPGGNRFYRLRRE